MKTMIDFLNRLDCAKIAYTLSKNRDFSVTVVAIVPGERWEIDFLFEDDEGCNDIWVERFKSDGIIHGKEELEVLFRDYAN